MSLSCGRVSAQNLAELAQNCKMFTLLLNKIMHFYSFYIFFACYYTFLCDFLDHFCTFSCAIFFKVQFCLRKKINFQKVCRLVVVVGFLCVWFCICVCLYFSVCFWFLCLSVCLFVCLYEMTDAYRNMTKTTQPFKPAPSN